MGVSGRLASMRIGTRMAASVGMPMLALVGALAIFYFVRLDVVTMSATNEAAVSDFMDAKRGRDGFADLQLAATAFVSNPRGDAEKVLASDIDRISSLEPRTFLNAGLSQTAVGDVLEGVRKVAEKRLSIGYDALGITGALAGASDSLRTNVTAMDMTDAVAPAIAQSYYDMVLAAAGYQTGGGDSSAQGVEDLAAKMKRTIGASFFGATKKADLTTGVDGFLAEFEKLVAARHDLDLEFSKVNSDLGTMIASLDQQVGASNEKIVQTSAGMDAALSRSTFLMTVVIGGSIIFCLGICWYLARSVSRQLFRLARNMEVIAGGDTEVALDHVAGRGEVARMTAAVEVFRENTIRVAALSDAEKTALESRRAERAEMMRVLQKAFGRVVDGAINGDFSNRVESQFADEELTGLAVGVNRLVETIDRGLRETGAVLAALADTDLTLRMDGEYAGAFATLKSDTNSVADKLSAIVAQLREASASLKTATGEILSGVNDLSRRTTRQTEVIQEARTSMEQLSDTVIGTAEKVQEASLAAGAVERTAQDGGAVMGKVTGAMDRITASSIKIADIIGLIDDIAFQTNLLALNASVEAARAGEAGQGFAVVAVEVRRLAQKAAEASSDVKALIEESAAEVTAGSRFVSEAAASLSAMAAAVRGNSDALDRIARTTHEQTSAIEKATTAVRVIDEIGQHNAALVEETNAALEQMEAQASDLDAVVASFTVAPRRRGLALGTVSGEAGSGQRGSPPDDSEIARRQQTRIAST